MSKNDLWKDWPDVPVEHTKHVNQRGGFTNIDAYWIVQTLTEQFGPMGRGWGLQDATHEVVCGDRLYLFSARFWWLDNDQVNEIPITTAVQLVTVGRDGNERIDEDAPKKAMTGAISKASSYLGLASQIYLGQWDKEGPSGGSESSTGSGSPVNGRSSNDDALRRLMGMLREEFGEGGLWPKTGEEATPTTKLKVAVFQEIFGTDHWNSVKALPEEEFQGLCTQKAVKDAVAKVKAANQDASSTTDGSPPVKVAADEVF